MPPTLAQRVLAYIRKHDMLRAGDRLGVAVSGGADSVALLRLLLELRGELGVVLSVVHFNHKIRGEAADADEQFVRELAASFGLEAHVSCGDTLNFAKETKMSLEAAARELRYRWFGSLMTSGAVDKVATAHTLDDQAETVLLRILRGTGTSGLAAIYPCLQLGDAGPSLARDHGADVEAGVLRRVFGTVIRPLLQVRRPELEAYLSSLGQRWCDDATNLSTDYTRNRVRHTLLPLLEADFNPAVRERLVELADIARAEEHFWDEQIHRVLDGVLTITETGNHAADTGTGQSPVPTHDLSTQERQTLYPTDQLHSEFILNCEALLKLPVALQRRVLLHLANGLDLHLEFKHVEQVLALAAGGPSAQIDLPGGWSAEYRRVWSKGSAPVRTGAELVLRRPGSPPSKDPTLRCANDRIPNSPERAAADYTYIVSVPGELRIPELNCVLSARLVDPTGAEGAKAENISGEPASAGYNPSQLLGPQTLTSELTVRNWRPGDRFWPAHTSAPRKVKELLQQKHVSGPERQLWPVVLSGNDIVWMKGFPVAQPHRANPEGGKALFIELRPLEDTDSGQ